MKLLRICALSWISVAATLFYDTGMAVAQEAATPASGVPAKDSQPEAQTTPPALRLTLQDALARARRNSTQFQSALTDAGLAREDKIQARDALLPSVSYNNEALYTQSNGPGNGVRYIANNAVHEYVSQGNVHETLDLASISSFRRASAAAAVARARAEIASRGLVVTIVQNYFAVAAAQQKLLSAQKAGDEGDRFFKLTQDLERGGEVAHSDVIVARAGYLPSLSLDYWYGIDAAQFAANTVINGQKFSNLGSSASATLNIPIWNWGATQSHVKQAELRRTQAQRELSLAQRKLLAEIKSLYAEAETALNELGGLNRSAELAEESLRLTTLRYKSGEATVLEVVDAQTTYAQASSAYQDGAVRYRVALANLQTLTGVLTTP